MSDHAHIINDRLLIIYYIQYSLFYAYGYRVTSDVILLVICLNFLRICRNNFTMYSHNVQAYLWIWAETGQTTNF